MEATRTWHLSGKMVSLIARAWVVAVVVLFLRVAAFTPSGRITAPARRDLLKCEYIPDGMTKAQWAAVKAKEKAEYEKVKGNLGKVGITKFQSRSFEAWQKSGQKNLFPVDPKAPITERPYMQRPGGMPDGSDLKKKGIDLGKLKFGAKPQAKTAIDAKYETLEKEGKLKSTPFSLPWSSEQASKVTAKASTSPTTPSVKSKVSSFSLPGKKATPPPPAPAPTPPAKKFFGLF